MLTEKQTTHGNLVSLLSALWKGMLSKMKFSNRAQNLPVAYDFQYNSSAIRRASRRFKSSGVLTSCLMVNRTFRQRVMRSFPGSSSPGLFTSRHGVHILDVLSVYHKHCESLKFRNEGKVFLIPQMILCVCIHTGI